MDHVENGDGDIPYPIQYGAIPEKDNIDKQLKIQMFTY